MIKQRFILGWTCLRIPSLCTHVPHRQSSSSQHRKPLKVSTCRRACIQCTMLRKLTHPQTTRQFARLFHNISLHRPGQPLSNLLYRPAAFGVARLSERGRYLDTLGPHRAIWGGQVAGFHTTRRNAAMPLVPFFAAILKVHPSRLGALGNSNLMSPGIRFYGVGPHRKQDSPLTCSCPPHKQS